MRTHVQQTLFQPAQRNPYLIRSNSYRQTPLCSGPMGGQSAATPRVPKASQTRDVCEGIACGIGSSVVRRRFVKAKKKAQVLYLEPDIGPSNRMNSENLVVRQLLWRNQRSRIKIKIKNPNKRTRHQHCINSSTQQRPEAVRISPRRNRQDRGHHLQCWISSPSLPSAPLRSSVPLV